MAAPDKLFDHINLTAQPGMEGGMENTAAMDALMVVMTTIALLATQSGTSISNTLFLWLVCKFEGQFCEEQCKYHFQKVQSCLLQCWKGINNVLFRDFVNRS